MKYLLILALLFAASSLPAQDIRYLGSVGVYADVSGQGFSEGFVYTPAVYGKWNVDLMVGLGAGSGFAYIHTGAGVSYMLDKAIAVGLDYGALLPVPTSNTGYLANQPWFYIVWSVT